MKFANLVLAQTRATATDQCRQRSTRNREWHVASLLLVRRTIQAMGVTGISMISGSLNSHATGETSKQ